MAIQERLCTRCAAIIYEDEKLLLAGHADVLGELCLTFPGGVKLAHETEEECAARQAFEETGLRVKIESLAYEMSWDLPLGRHCELYYLARPEGGELCGDRDPANELGNPRPLIWVPAEGLADISFRPMELLYRLADDVRRRFEGAPYPAINFGD
jgi:ADP-ribose pyrophosphatase YjhB (NUDIX family)